MRLSHTPASRFTHATAHYAKHSSNRLRRYARFDQCADNQITAIQRCLKKLTYRQREIIKMRFGLGGTEGPKSVRECAEVFKVSGGRIRQIERKAMKKLLFLYQFVIK